ncbi:unnamed protein product [Phytophthora fragariaefolia]|uniref:Unnamed protein product n=1 Tax=Phytophthora fragariaefolia TaxID=1490495 RepID=A0A9W7CKU8_9STRA|nr:unnamed protein product [Phytophthora fragariaefolia]
MGGFTMEEPVSPPAGDFDPTTQDVDAAAPEAPHRLPSATATHVARETGPPGGSRVGGAPTTVNSHWRSSGSDDVAYTIVDRATRRCYGNHHEATARSRCSCYGVDSVHTACAVVEAPREQLCGKREAAAPSESHSHRKKKDDKPNLVILKVNSNRERSLRTLVDCGASNNFVRQQRLARLDFEEENYLEICWKYD